MEDTQLPPSASWAAFKQQPTTRHFGTFGNTLALAVLSAALVCGPEASAQIQRLLGLDVSAWQGTLSQTVWNNLRTNDNRQFVIIRSSRGGTTGYYDQNDASNSRGNNTLSQRYDDPYYIQNINRATAAGIFAGSYHFSRPDIIESTLNSGGIRNNGTDEANHFIQMAGPWMRPGYLVPIHDLEAGDGIRTDGELAQFCIDFSSRIYQVMGIRPGIYTSGNYAQNVLGGSGAALQDALAKPAANLPSVVSPAYPTLWSARWPNQTDPNSIDVQNGEPKDSYTNIYGPWDDYGVTHPWKFWQYASTAHLPSYSTTKNLDVDVVRGGIEFLKDQLVPAVWMRDVSGDWSTLTNWNSGQTPIAPVPGPGQVTPVATGPLPTPRLPGAAGTGVTSGQHDTVILERPNANIAVALTTGVHNIRKLYMREVLNITGGSLNINYVPSPDSTAVSAQLSGATTLSGTGSLSAHTLQVDPGRILTCSGGTLTFNALNLMPGAAPSKLLVNGSISMNPLANASAVIASGTGSGTPGSIDFAGATGTINVGNGTADVDVAVNVAVANGALVKGGPGTMALTAANTYSGGTTISAGRLLVNNTSGSGTGAGVVTVDGGTLAGTGRIAGVVTVNSGGTIASGTTAALGTLTLGNAPYLAGTNLIRVNGNAGYPLSDRLVVATGPLNYGGTLAIANVGGALSGGEVFTPFSASVYTGQFASANLPALNAGLNWYLGDLTVNGSIKVNRSPIANGITLTNTPGQALQILTASLLARASDPDSDPLELGSFDSSTTNGVVLSSDGSNITFLGTAYVADSFKFVIRDNHGGSSTGLVQIIPVDVAPIIITHPQSRTNVAGTDATFSVAATGTQPISYQWRYNNFDIGDANASTYTQLAVKSSDAGGYSVVLSNIAGMVTSSTAGLTVVQPLSARIVATSTLPDGRFRFQVSGDPGHYAVEATTNFLDWEEQTNFITTSNLFEYVDPGMKLPFRSYRTRQMD